MKTSEAASRALEDKMIQFCQEAHRGQVYSWDRPYTYHLRAVRDNVLRWLPWLPYGVDPLVAILVAWGHDLLEDCPSVTYEILVTEFGQEVADGIQKLTNSHTGPTKESRNTLYHAVVRQDPMTVFVKICDRMANVEAGGKTEKYRKEHVQFRKELYRAAEFEPMWFYLDSLLEEK